MKKKKFFGRIFCLVMDVILQVRLTFFVAIFLTGALFSFYAAAQTESPATNSSTNPPGNGNDSGAMTPPAGVPMMGASVDYSYVGRGNVSFPGASGNSDAQSVHLGLAGGVPINEKWFIPLGLDSHNLFLGTVPGAPVPDQIHTMGITAGLGYRLNDQWTLVGAIGPRLFRFDDIEGDDIGVGGIIRAAYKVRPNLALALGVEFETGQQPPVLPAAGLRWDIRPSLELELMWPRSGLLYRVNNKLNVFAGIGGDFAAFRTSQNLGRNIGQPVYDNALGTYRDFRVGVGGEYYLMRGLVVDVEGGYSLQREIDYQDIGQTVSFGNSPYVQVGLRYRF